MNKSNSKSDKNNSKEKNLILNQNNSLNNNSMKKEYYKKEIGFEENVIISNNENQISESFIGKKRTLNNFQTLNSNIENNLKENNIQKLTKMKNKTNHKKKLADTNTYNLIHLENLFNDKENIFSFYVILINKKISRFGFICYISIDYPIFFFIYSKIEQIKKSCKIYKINSLKLDEKQISIIKKFNLKLSREIFPSENNKKNEEKKDKTYHLIVPIFINYYENCPYIDFDLMRKFIEPHLDNKKIDLLNIKNINNLIYNKTTQELLEYENHFNKNDRFDTFIDLLCFNDNEFKNEIIKSFNNNKINGTFEEYYENKISHKCSAILKLYNHKKYKVKELKISDNILYLKIYSGKKNEIALYNKDKDENKQKQIISKNKVKYLYSLYPDDELIYFLFSKEEIELYIAIPNIFLFFIRFLYPYELIKKINMENILNKNSYQYFIYACTPPSCGLFFNYETLETLGDTILKFFITSEIIFNTYNKENKNSDLKIGDLEKLRVSYINNKYLSQKGENLNIGNHIIPIYSVDLFKQIKFEISSKTIADILESLIAACFLSRNKLIDSLTLIEKSKIWENFSENTLLRCNINSPNFNLENYLLSQKKIPSKEMSFLDGLNFLKKENEYITIEKIEEYYIKNQNNKNKIDLINRYQNFEKVIGYNFKNKRILRNIFTSVSYDVINNYEKLELLGDSIVEIFIEIFLYKIFAPLIYENDNYIAKKLNLESQIKKFNNSTVTKIKSFLCSNNFMCKLSYIWTLPLYFKYSGEKIGKNYEKFLKKENIQKILNRKFIEYENSSSEFPKFIADIFEALIGGIYIDSNLENCFQLLYKMYFPYLLYCIYYFDDIKISAVNDFSDLCGEIKQMPHFYSFKNEDGYIVKACINDKLFFEGKGLSPSEAKQNAAQLGIKKIKECLKII